MPAATRALSGKILQQVAQHVPGLVGGSADLASSCKTTLAEEDHIQKNKFDGRNIHFGIREHAMGAITNGMRLHGSCIPFSSTFLVFSDYMRPAIRLAALSKLQNIFVFTHDSFHVGEDGPTHQPVEQVPSLRLIPNHQVIRPCDAYETAMAWKWALEKTDGPTSIILTRQNLPEVAQDMHPDLDKGGYILSEGIQPELDLILIATGSEVGLAMETKALLEKKDKSVRVVSIPCLERFAEQDTHYIHNVLPENIRTVAIEAAQGDLWYKWVGADGLVISMDEFGASGPGKVVAEHFGFTPNSVFDQIMTLV
jgi:transketolase